MLEYGLVPLPSNYLGHPQARVVSAPLENPPAWGTSIDLALQWELLLSQLNKSRTSLNTAK